MPCPPYGNHKLCYNPVNCIPILDKIKDVWDQYWNEMSKAYESMLDENDVEEWGAKNWLSEKVVNCTYSIVFQIRIQCPKVV